MPERSPVGLLALHDQPIGLLEQAAGRRAHDQRRHQVLEHRARPGDQRRPVSERRRGPAEAEPVPGRDIALGDGEQAGEPRLRCEQIVAARCRAGARRPNSRSTSSLRSGSSRNAKSIASAMARAVSASAFSRPFRTCGASASCRSRTCSATVFRSASIQNTRSGGPSSSTAAMRSCGHSAGLFGEPLQGRRQRSRSPVRPSAGCRFRREQRRAGVRARCSRRAGRRRRRAPGGDGRSCRAAHWARERRRVHSSQALASAIRWPARLPLSTDET